MSRLVKSLFARYPRTANCAVYGTLYTSAELSQQVFTKRLLHSTPVTGEAADATVKKESLDVASLGRFAVFGTLIAPNILYPWYRWLDARFKGTAGRTVVKKLLLDQFICTPPLYVVFYLSMSLMEGKSDIFEECRTKFAKTFMTSCGFWLPAQTVNFLWVPPAARVVYVGSSSLLWVNILCWLKRESYAPLDADLDVEAF